MNFKLNPSFFLPFYLILTTGLLMSCESKPKAPHIEGDLALAKVGSTYITSSQLMEQVQLIEERTPQVLSTHVQKKNLLQQMILIEMISQSKEESELRNSFASKAQFAEKHIQNILNEVESQMTEAALQAFYEKNKFRVDQVSARHILKRVDRRATPDERNRIYSEMQSLREQLIADPSQFQELAKQKSEDPGSASKGGDLGFFTTNQMVPEFSKAAFGLEQINQISEIVTTEFGYHIIQLVDKKVGLKTHREILSQKLREQLLQESFEEKKLSLQEKIDSEIYEENLISLSPLPAIVETEASEVLPENIDLSFGKSK